MLSLYDNLLKYIQETYQKYFSLIIIKICIHIVFSIKYSHYKTRHMPLAHEYKLGWCFLLLIISLWYNWIFDWENQPINKAGAHATIWQRFLTIFVIYARNMSLFYEWNIWIYKYMIKCDAQSTWENRIWIKANLWHLVSCTFHLIKDFAYES